MATAIECAIGALTRRLGTAPDHEIGALVAERGAMREELRSLIHSAAANVIPLDKNRGGR